MVRPVARRPKPARLEPGGVAQLGPGHGARVHDRLRANALPHRVLGDLAIDTANNPVQFDVGYRDVRLKTEIWNMASLTQENPYKE